VAKSFATSDQRFYYVPCPNPKCGHMQTLKFKNLTGIKTLTALTILRRRTSSARRTAALSRRSTRQKCFRLGVAGDQHPLRSCGLLYLDGLCLQRMRRGGRSLRSIIAAKEDILLRKTFTNTTLGETWEESGESVDPNSLIRRSRTMTGDVPLPVTTLTFALTFRTTDLRRLCSVGPKEECWCDRLQDFSWLTGGRSSGMG